MGDEDGEQEIIATVTEVAHKPSASFSQMHWIKRLAVLSYNPSCKEILKNLSLSYQYLFGFAKHV
jgi:hypothetical protein